jgi:hypothetical protein
VPLVFVPEAKSLKILGTLRPQPSVVTVNIGVPHQEFLVSLKGVVGLSHQLDSSGLASLGDDLGSGDWPQGDEKCGYAAKGKTRNVHSISFQDFYGQKRVVEGFYCATGILQQQEGFNAS